MFDISDFYQRNLQNHLCRTFSVVVVSTGDNEDGVLRGRIKYVFGNHGDFCGSYFLFSVFSYFVENHCNLLFNQSLNK